MMIDYTHKVYIKFLRRKSDAYSAMVSYIAKVERQINHNVKVIRVDNRVHRQAMEPVHLPT